MTITNEMHPTTCLHGGCDASLTVGGLQPRPVLMGAAGGVTADERVPKRQVAKCRGAAQHRFHRYDGFAWQRMVDRIVPWSSDRGPDPAVAVGALLNGGVQTLQHERERRAQARVVARLLVGDLPRAQHEVGRISDGGRWPAGTPSALNYLEQNRRR